MVNGRWSIDGAYICMTHRVSDPGVGLPRTEDRGRRSSFS